MGIFQLTSLNCIHAEIQVSSNHYALNKTYVVSRHLLLSKVIGIVYWFTLNSFGNPVLHYYMIMYFRVCVCVWQLFNFFFFRKYFDAFVIIFMMSMCIWMFLSLLSSLLIYNLQTDSSPNLESVSFVLDWGSFRSYSLLSFARVSHHNAYL